MKDLENGPEETYKGISMLEIMNGKNQSVSNFNVNKSHLVILFLLSMS